MPDSRHFRIWRDIYYGRQLKRVSSCSCCCSGIFFCLFLLYRVCEAGNRLFSLRLTCVVFRRFFGVCRIANYSWAHRCIFAWRLYVRPCFCRIDISEHFPNLVRRLMKHGEKIFVINNNVVFSFIKFSGKVSVFFLFWKIFVLNLSIHSVGTDEIIWINIGNAKKRTIFRFISINIVLVISHLIG